MNDRARAILDRARETLARTADVRIERRSDDDDALLSWRRGMPKPEPAISAAEVDRRINAKFAAHDETRLQAHGMVIAEERKRFRHELDKLRRSFNEDILTVKRALQSDFNRHRNVTRGELEDARKRIAELQRKVDDLTFEKTFATSKIIDLPPLPLRGSRHG